MANTSGAGNLADLFKTFGPAFFGTGTTTTSSTPDATAMAQSRGIASQAFANADNAESVTNDIVNRIITKNANAFGPVAAGAHTAGLYNDTVLKQLAAEASAASTGEASKAVLDYRTNQLGIAQNATASQLASSRTTTSRTASQVPSSVTQLLGLGVGTLAAYKNKKDILSFFGMDGKNDPDAGKLLDPITGKPTSGTDSLSPDAGQRANDAAFGDTSNPTTVNSGPVELGNNLPGSEDGDNAQQVGAMTSSDISVLSEDQTAALDGNQTDALTGTNDAANTADALDATNTTADAAEGVGEATAENAGEGAAELGAESAGDLIASDVPYLNLLVSAIKGFSGDTEGAGMSMVPGLSIAAPAVEWMNTWAPDSIICAELHKQGRLSDSLARRSLMHFQKYKDVSREAYYIWATPSVKHLQKYPTSRYSKALASIFNLRSKHLLSPTIATTGAYYLVSTVTVACWPLLKLRNLVDRLKMQRYLAELYRRF